VGLIAALEPWFSIFCVWGATFRFWFLDFLLDFILLGGHYKLSVIVAVDVVEH
jgi:hypothetical protein